MIKSENFNEAHVGKMMNESES